ncbi:hypothetical protein PMIN06_007441 [Paraphaeosphaeria minitans]
MNQDPFETRTHDPSLGAWIPIHHGTHGPMWLYASSRTVFSWHGGRLAAHALRPQVSLSVPLTARTALYLQSPPDHVSLVDENSYLLQEDDSMREDDISLSSPTPRCKE